MQYLTDVFNKTAERWITGAGIVAANRHRACVSDRAYCSLHDPVDLFFNTLFFLFIWII